MKIGRRAFMLGAAIFGAAPVFAKLMSSFSTMRSRESPVSELLPSIPTVGAMETSGIEFKIGGWNRYSGPTAPADSIDQSAAVAAVWISINQSWRSGWR